MPVDRGSVANIASTLLRKQTPGSNGFGVLTTQSGADTLLANVRCGVFPHNTRRDSYQEVAGAPTDTRKWTVASRGYTGVVAGDLFNIPTGPVPGTFRVEQVQPPIPGQPITLSLCIKES